MRTTINLEDDIYSVLKVIAESTSRPIGKVASELIRKGLHQHKNVTYDNGIPVFEVSESAQIITIDDVKKDEDDI